ncbi:MAG TPA: PEP-CTERM sorting domain-containing protein [Bryobacteraceae bacterium]|nr:PEP-CTERM sorting domain-containing protein [Bryobacteraceae bacterium]
MEHWPVYAAVTGAAMAMATNASAGVIYSGTLDTTVAVASVQRGSAEKASNQHIAIGTFGGVHVGFNISVAQANTADLRFGGVGMKASHVDFLWSSGNVRRLSSGAKISANLATRSNSENGFLAVAANPVANLSNSTAATTRHRIIQRSEGWAASSATKGFAAFKFKNGAQTDYGWVRLQYTVGTNDLLNSITVIDWGYATGGVSINAGQGIPPAAPEPSTTALTLLAAGAAGVEFLRRRRKATS